jgi:hypothetical protein
MAFYRCEKCNLTWQIPIEICPHCFGNLTEQKGKQARVIGITRVGIPTLNHPGVPYFILLLQDENGNIWAHKSSKEREIGTEFKAEPVLDSGAVAVWRVKYNYLEAVKKVLELLGGAKIDGSSKILILPTASSATHYYFRDNTNPQFFEAVLDYLSEAGVATSNITVGTQSFDDIPIGAIAQKSGLLEVCQKRGIMPKDLSGGTFEKKGKFEIAKDALEADLILNLAMPKMGQASATQNLFRLLKKENFLGLKYLGSEADIVESFKEIGGKIITVADAENVQRSNKFTTFLGLVMAGRDAMTVDRIFNEIVKANRLPELVKDIGIEDIPLAGRSIQETQYQAEIF